MHYYKILSYIALFMVSLTALADTDNYTAPKTPFGQTLIQGVWNATSLTMLERPDKVESLNVSKEMAHQISSAIRANFPDNIDPDIPMQGIDFLATVQGKYRSSVVTDPENGKIPYSEHGLELVAWADHRDEMLFDHPEQRPLAERCLGDLGFPPIRMFVIFIPHLIVQTPDHVVIYTEDPGGARIISLADDGAQQLPLTWQGHSVGHWQDGTLEVKTTHFRADEPARLNIGRALLIGEHSTVTEYFTRVSATELLYQFTVEDPEFYSQPWSGEYSFYQSTDAVYEYACHEGNYSMASTLRGGQMEQAELAEEQARGEH